MLAQSLAVWPLLMYFLVVVALVAAILGICHLLGQRHREKGTGVPYESGMLPTGSARLRMPADFYLIAMFFVIFDLESIFVFSWAVAVRELGWAGYAALVVFVGVLGASLAYLWRSGALNWGPADPASGARKRQGGGA